MSVDTAKVVRDFERLMEYTKQLENTVNDLHGCYQDGTVYRQGLIFAAHELRKREIFKVS